MRVWQARSAAVTLTSGADIGALEANEGEGVVLEDIDRAGYEESWLFHLLNLVRERDLSLLLTARKAPIHLDFSLPDLTSRLNAVPAIRIGAPDDALLKTVMLKHFADRQLAD